MKKILLVSAQAVFLLAALIVGGVLWIKQLPFASSLWGISENMEVRALLLPQAIIDGVLLLFSTVGFAWLFRVKLLRLRSSLLWLIVSVGSSMFVPILDVSGFFDGERENVKIRFVPSLVTPFVVNDTNFARYQRNAELEVWDAWLSGTDAGGVTAEQFCAKVTSSVSKSFTPKKLADLPLDGSKLGQMESFFYISNFPEPINESYYESNHFEELQIVKSKVLAAPGRCFKPMLLSEAEQQIIGTSVDRWVGHSKVYVAQNASSPSDWAIVVQPFREVENPKTMVERDALYENKPDDEILQQLNRLRMSAGQPKLIYPLIVHGSDNERFVSIVQIKKISKEFETP